MRFFQKKVNMKKFLGVNQGLDASVEKIVNLCIQILNIKNTHQNVLISPVALFFSLANAVTAADGKTRKEILDVMEMNYSEVMILQKKLRMILLSEDSPVNMANGIYVNKLCQNKIIPDFMNKTGIELLPDTVTGVNKWVEHQTKGMIKSITDTLNDLDDFSLINSIAFLSKWKNKYMSWNIDDGQFRNMNGTFSQVTYLESTEAKVIDNSLAKGFIKPYENSRYLFMALLPNGRMKPQTVLRRINGADLIHCVKKSINMKMRVKMPEFSFETEESIMEELNELGITSLFDEKHADLSNLTDVAGSFIKDIHHKAFIRNNRKGTMAADVFDMSGDFGCPLMEQEKVFILNRPFIFCICESRTGLPVFIGVVNIIK